MSQLEHPMISQIEKTGYPKEMKQEAEGSDYFGFEYFKGDDVVEFDGEIVLRDNLDDFLQALGFTFKTL